MSCFLYKREGIGGSTVRIMFKTPSNILVVGPSQSGKTFFVTQLLQDRSRYFKPAPSSVHYCYGVRNKLMPQLQKQGVQFHEGLPDGEATLDAWFKGRPGILVIDDLMAEGGNSKELQDIFTKFSHHKDLTVIYLTQDIFPSGRYSKTISRNFHYMVVFNNPRDGTGLRNLLVQAFPAQWRTVLDTTQRLLDRPHGYVMFDFHPATPNGMRVYTDVLKRDGVTRGFRISS